MVLQSNSLSKVRPLLFATGFSMGSNMLSLYLGNNNTLKDLDGVQSFGNPFDLRGVYEHVESEYFSELFYQKLYLPRRKAIIKRFMNHEAEYQLFNNFFDFDKLLNSKSNREFDSNFII